VSKGVFSCDDPDKQFAVLSSPLLKKFFIEARLTIREKTGSDWKIAGISVFVDEKNYWHLALAEKPDSAGGGHFVELVEMYDNAWLSQSITLTKLTPLASKGGSFNWEYNHPYILRIEMADETITGFVKELDGTIRSKLGFRFNNEKAVKYGKPALDNGSFRAEFDDFSVKAEEDMKSAVEDAGKPSFAPYESRGWEGLKGKASGFFRVEQAKGTWWVIDPFGNAFYIIGTDHASFKVHWCEKLGYAPYSRNCEKIYGTEEKWSDSTVGRLLSWGFNSLGANSSLFIRHRGLAHTEILGMGTMFAGMENITPRTTWTGFPNVFSSRFEKYCDKLAQKICAPVKDDPWLIGYFIDNELEWYGTAGKGIFDDAFSKPAENSAKKAIVEMLINKYNKINMFNEAWGTNLYKFEELYELKKLPGSASPQAQADRRDFIRLAAEKYFSITSAAIRRHDPNHMVLGCRFAGSAPDVWDIAGRYCDIVSVNCYRTVDLEKGILADGFEKDLASWYGSAKRPMMITEWSFPALDAGLPCKGGAGQRVPIQKDKAFAFTVFQKLLFATPFLVGSDYFMWADEPELGISKTFPEDSNYGLVNVNDEPYTLLTRAATDLHQYVYTLHSRNAPEISVRPGKEKGSFEISNSGETDAACSIEIIMDGKVIEQRKETIGGNKSVELKATYSFILAPGGHLLACKAKPENEFLELDRTNNIATQVLYVPGAAWWDKAQKNSSERLPFVICNFSDKTVKDASVILKTPDIYPFLQKAKKLSVVCASASGVINEIAPFQARPAEGEIAVFANEIKPMECATFYLYNGNLAAVQPQRSKIEYKKEGDVFGADNGVMKFYRTDAAKGNAFDRIELKGIELGRFTPLVWQKVGQNMWIGPDSVENIEINHGPVFLSFDMTFSFSRGGSEMKTEVDSKGNYASMTSRPHSFRAKYRITIFPEKQYFSSRMLWIENTDKEPWELGAYYHYLVSNINGSVKDDEARGTKWFDPGTGISFGAAAFSPEIKITFWKDPGGTEHPDTWREVGKMLKPGERYSDPQPEVYIIAAKTEGEWKEIIDSIKFHSALSAQSFPIEK